MSEEKLETVEALEEENGKKKNSLTTVLLIILLLLFLLSVIILAIRIGDFLPNGSDIIFIEPKEPEMIVEDDKKVWEGKTDIDIFSASYVNGKGEATVVSSNGDKIVAPGTDGFYKFSFKNIGNMAIDYKCTVTLSFEAKGAQFDIEDLPIMVRMKDYQGNYIIGDGEKWEPVSVLETYTDGHTIGKNSYIYYTIEWCWPYESGNDRLDTLLGNLSANESVVLTLKIDAYGEQSDDPDAIGGLQSGTDDPRQGGDIVPAPYIILNVIILLIIAGLIVIEYIKRKKDKAALAEAIGEDVATGVVEGAADIISGGNNEDENDKKE